MDTLPVELFAEILSYLPPASCKSARLTSRQFNAVLAKPTFDKLSTFIDPDTALKTAQDTLYGLATRQRPMWSPNCSVPDDLPLPRSFLHAMYTALGGQPWTPKTAAVARRRQFMLADSSDESSSDESELELPIELPEEESEDYRTAAVMLQRLGRPELNEKMLRQALFRYALYKSYIYEGEGEAPELWVMNTTKWKHQL
ncbi:hypothetical protein NLG97_g9586 [Lecanicillium saksenae]|uniref:Uncharacterized protein n=1 Tax=Lecanicillium saksenae TaxID=468837 RepID=A0ACC1QIW1_9HYPO|nr:hypothetical protein NLG97_g9586 [Lecanicillium saksenae]